MTPKAFLIGGDWVSSTQSFEIKNPYTHEPVGSYFQADPEQVEQAFQSAHEAFERNRELTPAARALFLNEVAAVIKRRSPEFVDLLIREAGKPVTQAETEVARAQSTFLFASSECLQPNGELIALDGSESGKKHAGSVRRWPIGLIFGITPFNFPLNLVAHKVAPALAAGNSIVIKPSPRTVLTALLLAESLQEAGVPGGLVNIVPFEVGLMDRYYNDNRVKMVSFTGSAAVGWKIKEKCNTKKVCLELGGNAAAIVHSDAEWQPKNWIDCQRSFWLCRTILHQHTAGLCTEPDLQRVSRRSGWLRERQSQDRRSAGSRDDDWSNDCAGSGAEGGQMG